MIRKFVVILLISVVLGSILLFNTQTVPVETSNTRIAHGVIIINNRMDLDNESAYNSWPGNGTEDNPIIIQDYEIDAHGEGAAIYIGNISDMHILIRNCTLYNTSYHNGYMIGAGLRLYWSHNITIVNTTIHDVVYGIFTDSSFYFRAQNNTIQYVSSAGMSMWWSQYVSVKNNTIKNARYGMNYTGIKYAEFINNVFTDINYWGIRAYYNYWNYIMDNVFNRTTYGTVSEGINIEKSKSILIQNNTITQASVWGVDIKSHSGDIYVVDNEFNYDYYGVYVDRNGLPEGGNISIMNNNFTGGESGIYIWGAFNVTTKENIIRESHIGIAIHASINTSHYSNTMYNASFFMDGYRVENFTMHDIPTNNTVNGAPVYYYKNIDMGNAVAPPSAGEVLLGNVKNFGVQNANMNRGTCGVVGGFTSHIFVKDSKITNMSYYALYFAYSDNITVDNSHLDWNTRGFYDSRGETAAVRNSTMRGNEDGIYSVYVDDGVYFNNTIDNSGKYGIHLFGGYYNDIENNTLLRNAEDNILLEFSQYTNVSGNEMRYSNGTYGGFYMYKAENNTVKNNIIVDKWEGIRSNSGKNNSYMNNYVSAQYTAIDLFSDENAFIKGNTIEDSKDGIYLYYSENSEIYENVLLNNSIKLYGFSAREYTYYTISTNNTVNGKPVRYFKNVDMGDALAPTDAGEIILGNVQNFVIDGFGISQVSVGVQIGYSSHITIKNTNMSDMKDTGIDIKSGDNITMSGMWFERCSHAVYVYTGENITVDNSTFRDDEVDLSFNYIMDAVVENNTMNATSWSGLSLEFSHRGVVKDNFFKDNRYYAIDTRGSDGFVIYNNTFYHNNGSNDTYDSSHVQARDYTTNNAWDKDGKGNYWSDWTTPDGNGDGIVDNPYVLDGGAGAQDNYPLTEPGVPVPELGGAMVVIIALLGIMVIVKRRE